MKKGQEAALVPGDPNIDWRYSGKPDLMCGTGATLLERGLVWSAAIAFPALLYLLVWSDAGGDWSGAQWAVAIFFAADLAGGVVANALNSAKRFYHAPRGPADGLVGRILKLPGVFAAGHIHPFIIALLWPEWQLWVGLVVYVYMLGANAVVMHMPLYLARPVAFAFIVLGIALASGLPTLPGWEWFVPLFLTKLVYGHAVREEPYRP